MMRLEDSREAGLLNSSTRYSSLETTRRTPEVDIPMSRRPKSKRQCYAVGACIVLIAVAAIVGAIYVVTWKKYAQDDSNKSHIRNEPQSFAQAPSPQEYAGHGWASSPPTPAVEAAEQVASPRPSPFSVIGPASLSTSDPSSYSPSFDLAPYEIICNKTINRAVCLNMFRSYPNLHKVTNLQQSTVMAMEAAAHALNESYVLAQGIKKKTEGNAALQQCIDVFADALEEVNTSMSLVAAMDIHKPGSTGADVQTFMSAAMTDQDTCQEGIDEVGPFPGSDQITGKQAKHVDTLLSIALTFVNHLTTSSIDPDHHRRLLHTKSTGSERIIILGRRGLLPRQSLRRLHRLRLGSE